MGGVVTLESSLYYLSFAPAPLEEMCDNVDTEIKRPRRSRKQRLAARGSLVVSPRARIRPQYRGRIEGRLPAAKQVADREG